MISTRVASAVVLASGLLAACGGPTTRANRQFVVEGPTDSVTRFMAAQTGSTSSVSFTITPLPEGRARGALKLSDRFADQDLLRTTDQALAEGLSYSVTGLQVSAAAA